MRRAHDAISAPSIVVENGNVRRPHRLNLVTGEYRGRKILKSSVEEIVE